MMKFTVLLYIALPAAVMANSAGTDTNPIEKVIEMMSDLQQKIIGEGKAAQAVYDEFAEWCEEESKNLGFTIKTAKANAEELNAVIEKCDADIAEFDEYIGELTSTISTDEADLKAATAIRTKENGIFVEKEAELVNTVDTLERAIGLIEREMAKNPGAAFLQIKNAESLAKTMKLLVDAAGVTSDDAQRLTAFLQGKNHESSLEEDRESETGAPDPAAYKSKGGGIVEVLSDLLTDAETQLEEARKKEEDNQFNYDTLKLELEDAIKFSNKELDKTEKKKAETEETKGVSQGDLDVVMKGLGEDMQQLADTHHDCMTKAEDFEMETQARAAELKAIAKAKKIIQEMTGGAAGQTYSLAEDDDDDTSFLQVSMKTHSDLASFEAVRRVETLAHQLHSTVLAQLAERLDAATQLASKTGDDPFAKVKGLIADMIETLLKEAEEEAAKKGYCDKEMGETKAKRKELNTEIEELTTKIDEKTAKSAKLKEEVAVLSKELAELAKTQQEMDKIRAEEKADYDKNKAEMEQGIEGVNLALKVLREYYASGGGAQGAGGGIISMLEVFEADFEKGLAELITVEEAAVAEYEKITKENAISKVTKEQDVKYKTKEAKGLDEAVAEHTTDKTALVSELESVQKYWDSLQEECIAKVPSYEERKKRRDAEIQGLKDALAILNGEAVLLQKGSSRKLRGVGRH